MSEKSVPKRQYTNEFKVEAIRLAETVGQHEAARRLGVPVATLGNWSRRSRSFEGGIETSGRDVSAQEAKRVREKGEELEEKIEISKRRMRSRGRVMR